MKKPKGRFTRRDFNIIIIGVNSREPYEMESMAMMPRRENCECRRGLSIRRGGSYLRDVTRWTRRAVEIPRCSTRRTDERHWMAMGALSMNLSILVLGERPSWKMVSFTWMTRETVQY